MTLPSSSPSFFRRRLSALALWALLLATAAAAIPAGWGTFRGAFFEIGVPPGFTATGKTMNPGGGRHDAVSLFNPTTQAEFYVYSPQWNGRSPYLSPVAGQETVTSRESKTSGGVLEEQLTISANNKSYIRFVVSRTKENENTNTTFGVRIPNMKVYEQIKPTYVRWKQTLTQFAD